MSGIEVATEVATLVKRAVAVAPGTEEVYVCTVVPITVGKGVIVSGDLAKPTTRTVFTVSVTRKDAALLSPTALLSRPGVYWDEDWARSAFKKAS